MGKRGRKPAPTALRLVRGYEARRINQAEPIPADLPVDKPEWLSELAAEEWDRVAPHLAAMAVLTAVDTMTLAAYCETYAKWMRLREMRGRTNPIFQGKEPGTWHRNPVYSQERDALAQFIQLAREFGFTPSARSGIRVEHVVTLPADRILNGSG
jgi:P27 family predicted phage terminase small subunit